MSAAHGAARHPAQPLLLAAGDQDAMRAAIDALLAGWLVGVPTETVYGVASALTVEAIERLLAAKRRSPTKGITLLVDDLAQMEPLADLSWDALRLAEAFWPGPLTLVLPARPGARLPATLTGETGTVGFRLPDHAAPRALARALGPLPLTSANVSGEPDATSADGVVAALGAALAVVLDGGRSPGGTPSTVVAVLPDSERPRVLRAGALSEQAIREVLARR